jgi:hypothetical protein
MEETMGLKGSCHCGATRFEVASIPDTVTRCTCSICSKRGALWAYYTPAQFKLETPREAMATYKWRTHSVSHNFCPTCGCTTFTESPDWSKGEPDFDNPRIAVNARIFDDFDLDGVPVVVIDGKNLW